MMDLVSKLYVKTRAFADALTDERGQDMVEYALVMGMIALGATAALSTVATTVAAGFTAVTGHLTTYTT